MTITIDIPDELIPAVAGILTKRCYPDDDGLTESNLMTEYNLSGEQFVQAEHIVDNLKYQIKNAINKKQSKLMIGEK